MRHYLLPLILLVAASVSLSANNLVTYAGSSGNERFFGIHELSDGSYLIGGSADDLSWLPSGTPTTGLNTTAANSSSIDNEGVNEGKVAFIMRLSSDFQTIQEVVHFPDGAADEIRLIKATSAPNAATTGDLYISGKRGKTSTGSKDGGFYIAKLNNNFIGGTPTGLEYVLNIPTHGKEDKHANIQPWDVMSDGKVVTIRYGAYQDNWGEILVFSDTPPSPPSSPEYTPTNVMPGFRYHDLDDGSSHYGTADTVPGGRTVENSRMVLKTQRTEISGLQRSFTPDNYHLWQKDENGFWRKGKYPLDTFWNNYWYYPSTKDTPEENNNMWGSDARGYTGYKLAGTGSTEGSPYTPRIGAITVDKRNDHIYLGLNWKSRLPDTNNPDFEPALIALDDQGYYKWWSRLYREYEDDGATAPQAIDGAVETAGTNTFTDSSLAGTSIDTSRITSGSDGYVNGYRRLYWKSGANAPGFSEIVSFDSSTGAFTLESAPDNPISAGDTFMVDATVMTKTHTSTPDQYIDAIAIDYSRTLDGSGNDGYLYVAARAHGNNVVNFWDGDAIKEGPGYSYHNQYTGSNGNAHYSWIGKLRDDATKATILASSWVAEYGEEDPFGDYSGMDSEYSDPNLDRWPSHNGGWPDLNTTGVGPTMWVNDQGQVCLIGTSGRSTLTTANAYQRNIRPFIKDSVTSASSTTEFVSSGLAGANLIMSSNLKIRFESGDNDGEIRTITAYDDNTGAITLDSALPSQPTAGDDFTIDEGEGQWNSFVRVFATDMTSLVYSSLLSSEINPVDGTGAGQNLSLRGIWPISEGLLVTGYHKDSDTDGVSDGNAVPLNNEPSWGTSTPSGEMAVLAKLSWADTGSTPTYTDWAAAYDWKGETATAATDDPDNDGIDNFTEYATGSTPIDGSSQSLPEVVKSGDTYYVRVNLGRDSSEVTYQVEFSETLAPWSTFSTQTLSGNAGDQVDVPLDMAGRTSLFARLKLTQ